MLNTRMLQAEMRRATANAASPANRFGGEKDRFERLRRTCNTFSTTQVERLTGINAKTLCKMIWRGALKAEKNRRGRWRFSGATVAELLEKRESLPRKRVSLVDAAGVLGEQYGTLYARIEKRIDGSRRLAYFTPEGEKRWARVYEDVCRQGDKFFLSEEDVAEMKREKTVLVRIKEGAGILGLKMDTVRARHKKVGRGKGRKRFFDYVLPDGSLEKIELIQGKRGMLFFRRDDLLAARKKKEEVRAQIIILKEVRSELGVSWNHVYKLESRRPDGSKAFVFEVGGEKCEIPIRESRRVHSKHILRTEFQLLKRFFDSLNPGEFSDSPDVFYTVCKAAELAGVYHTRLAYLVRAGRLRAKNFSRLQVIPGSELAEFFEETNGFSLDCVKLLQKGSDKPVHWDWLVKKFHARMPIDFGMSEGVDGALELAAAPNVRISVKRGLVDASDVMLACFFLAFFGPETVKRFAIDALKRIIKDGATSKRGIDLMKSIAREAYLREVDGKVRGLLESVLC